MKGRGTGNVLCVTVHRGSERERMAATLADCGVFLVETHCMHVIATEQSTASTWRLPSTIGR